MTPILELRGITKRFPGVLANDHINLTLEKGQIHALLGENGAGKTTLMNILYGLYQPDEGEIFINGQKVTIHSPADAIAQG
ncbi:ATP-binding cassette domain-containing protein, partial [Thermanaerothrix sp.]